MRILGARPLPKRSHDPADGVWLSLTTWTQDVEALDVDAKSRWGHEHEVPDDARPEKAWNSTCVFTGCRSHGLFVHYNLRTAMKSILDPSFRYTPSAATDLRKTFARVRRELRKSRQATVPTNVQPLRRDLSRRMKVAS